MKKLRFSGITLVLLLCAAAVRPASANIINASVTIGYYPGISCAGTETFSGQSVEFNVDGSIMSCPPGGFVSVIGDFGPLSGSLHTENCDPMENGHTCSGTIRLEGDYYFAGSGVQTFNFGSFSDPGIGWVVLTSTLTIDDQQYNIQPLFRFSPLVTLQLGEVHHLTYSGVFGVGEDGSFSYDFSTPGIGPFLVPEPGSGLLVVVMISAFILFRRAGLRFKNKVVTGLALFEHLF